MLAIGLTFSRTLMPHWMMGLLTQQWPTNLSRRYIVTENMPIADAREHISNRAIELEAGYLLFVDDDTILPQRAVTLLKYELDQNPNAAAIGAIVCTKSHPPEPIVFKPKGAGAFWGWRVGEVFECDGVGMGCMMIRVDALKNLPRPLFQMSDNQSETMFFCNRLKAAGFKLLAHGGVLCEHWDMESGQSYSLLPDSLPFQRMDKKMVVRA